MSNIFFATRLAEGVVGTLNPSTVAAYHQDRLLEELWKGLRVSSGERRLYVRYAGSRVRHALADFDAQKTNDAPSAPRREHSAQLAGGGTAHTRNTSGVFFPALI